MSDKKNAKKREIDPKAIERAAACGCTDREIATIFALAERTLQRRYREALDAGRARLRKCLRRKQLEVARKGSVPMLIWLGKQYLGQKDRQEVTAAERVEVVEEVVFTGDDREDAKDGDDDAEKTPVDAGFGAVDAAAG